MNATPVRFATYQGDLQGEVGTRKGPNLLGEVLTVVTAAPRLHRDGRVTTRLGFRYGATQPEVQVRDTAFGLLIKIDDQDWRRP